VGVLEEERAKRSELEAHRCVYLGMLEVFGQYHFERGAMPDPFGATPHLFGAMPDANVETRSVARIAPRRVGSDAQIERRDALREGRHAPPVPCDALPVSCDALPVSCDALPVSCDALLVPWDAPRIRSDAVRRGRRHS
jgi:hypothetical protein